MRALWVSDRDGFERFESVQPEYNLGKRDIEGELFDACSNQDVGIIPYQIFMGGVLTGRYSAESPPPSDSHMASRHAQRAKDTYWTDHTFKMVETLKETAAELEISVPQLLIAWTLSKPQITSVIVGASRPEQAQSNAEAVSRRTARGDNGAARFSLEYRPSPSHTCRISAGPIASFYGWYLVGISSFSADADVNHGVSRGWHLLRRPGTQLRLESHHLIRGFRALSCRGRSTGSSGRYARR